MEFSKEEESGGASAAAGANAYYCDGDVVYAECYDDEVFAWVFTAWDDSPDESHLLFDRIGVARKPPAEWRRWSWRYSVQPPRSIPGCLHPDIHAMVREGCTQPRLVSKNGIFEDLKVFVGQLKSREHVPGLFNADTARRASVVYSLIDIRVPRIVVRQLRDMLRQLTMQMRCQVSNAETLRADEYYCHIPGAEDSSLVAHTGTTDHAANISQRKESAGRCIEVKSALVAFARCAADFVASLAAEVERVDVSEDSMPVEFVCVARTVNTFIAVEEWFFDNSDRRANSTPPSMRLNVTPTVGSGVVPHSLDAAYTEPGQSHGLESAVATDCWQWRWAIH